MTWQMPQILSSRYKYVIQAGPWGFYNWEGPEVASLLLFRYADPRLLPNPKVTADG
jgi:hypothetical protein